jgi:hypothetical protein
MRLAILLTFALLPMTAEAWNCRDFLVRAYDKAEAIEAKVGNLRKNLLATIFKPEELKTFSVSFFERERERIADSYARHRLLSDDLQLWDPPRPDEPYNDVTPPAAGKTTRLSLELESLRFETKLASLEVAIQNANGERLGLGEMLDSLPPFKKQRLVKAVNGLFSGSPLTETALQYHISDLYIDLLKWHYPHLLEGVGADAVERTLRSTFETRLVTRSVAKTLKDAGLVNVNPNVFRSYFESLLKGQALDFLINGQINLAMIKGALSSNLVPYWLALPTVRFNRWIEIPEDLLILAEQRGLEPVWNDSIKPYLISRYGTMTRVDLIYSHLQKFWAGATYYAFMGWLGFTLTWTVPTEVTHQVRQKEVQHQFEKPPVPATEEKTDLSPDEKNAAWDAWAKEHPAEASDPTCPEYRFMRKIIFGAN